LLSIFLNNNKNPTQKVMSIDVLLKPFNTPFNTPPFTKIKDEDFLPAFREAIKTSKAEIDKIIENKTTPSFKNTIEELDYAGITLSQISNIFFNLNHANTNETIQKAAREAAPMLTAFYNDIWLNAKLFDKVKYVWENANRNLLRDDQVKLLEDTYSSFVRKGAKLTDKQKNEYRQISSELSKLSINFGEHVLAETNDFKLHITDKNQLSGLPEGILESASALAKKEGKEGWIFSLQFPSYMPFMKYADNRELRKSMFLEFSKRGNRNNDNDNKEVIKKIVNNRLKLAKLLSYNTIADLILEKSMAASKLKVLDFLNQLLEASYSFGKEDVKEIEDYAHKLGLKGKLQRWDYAYYAEKLKKEKFGIDDEATRPYFELKKVEKAVFGLAGRLYGISFIENKDIPKYHEEVKTFEVKDEDGTFLGILYVDYYPRASKQGGAWMTSFREQYIKDGKEIRPLISLVMNFTRPTEKKPSLLTFMEVKTFLHEFGHSLHGLLSKVHYISQSGTNVYRDFVELPSQIMENWALEREWLIETGVHYKTAEPISDKLIDKLIESGKYQSGYATVRQLSFGISDMAWHTLEQPFEGNVIAFERKAMEPTELLPYVEGTAVCTAFSHIFNGGYAAGYYGYKWAEVLDADAFELFKENGIYNKETATSFRKNILEKGGTKHPMELYVAFRGSEPDIKPLLKRSGLIKE
jgi:peptidyl-dipeptidase Dcp